MRRRHAKLSGNSEHLRLDDRNDACDAMTEHKNPVLMMHWVFAVALKIFAVRDSQISLLHFALRAFLDRINPISVCNVKRIVGNHR